MLAGMSLRAAQAPATAVVLDARTGKLVESMRFEQASRTVATPGSTLKPLILSSLLETGRLRVHDAFPCSGTLVIEGRSFACVHPRMNTPIDVPTAIAYSCNEFVAHAVERWKAGEQLSALRRWGLSSRTGLDATEAIGKLQLSAGSNATLQALGEFGIEVSVLELALAYRRLAGTVHALARKGLEDAVEFGTAQRAQVKGVKIAGKTGSSGNGRWAWFAGFAPSVQPKFIVAVRTQGASGGADAAPIAGELLASAFRDHV